MYWTPNAFLRCSISYTLYWMRTLRGTFADSQKLLYKAFLALVRWAGRVSLVGGGMIVVVALFGGAAGPCCPMTDSVMAFLSL